MRARWRRCVGAGVGGLAGGVLVAACVNLGPYQCADDAQCRTAEGDGWCEATNYCSYPDDQCESGRRYSDLAAGLANTCTVPSPSTADGSGSGSSSDGTSEDTATPQPVCGNGVVEGDEECDELDGIDGDGCNTDCLQGGAVRWSHVIASDRGGNDRLFGLTQLVSGDVVAAGYLQADSADILITRFTVDGDEVQRVVYDVDGGFDEAEAVAQGGTGRVYVCGRATVGGSSVPWVGRWDATLTEPPGFDEVVPEVPGACHGIAYVNSGEIVAAGGNGSTAWAFTFGDGNVGGGSAATASQTGVDRLRAATRSAGGLAYVAGQVGGLGVVYQPDSEGLGTPLVQTRVTAELQTVVVTLDTIYAGGLLEDQAELDDLWVSAHDLEGVELWRYTPGLAAIDEVEDLAVDGAGNVFLIGHVVSDFPDRWVAKLDPAGEPVWSRTGYPGSEGDDRGRSIEVLPSGDLIVVGEVTGPGGDLDGWIARLAP